MFLKKIKERISNLEEFSDASTESIADLASDIGALRVELAMTKKHLDETNRVLLAFIKEHYKGRNPPLHVEAWIEKSM